MTSCDRLVLAALASAGVHALAISGAWMPLPQLPGTSRPLEARLAPLPPEIQPAAPRPGTRARRRTAPPPFPPVPTMAAPSPLALPEFDPEDEYEDTAAGEPAAPEPPQQVALAAESSSARTPSLPRRGRITYALVYGESGLDVGKAVHTWEFEAGAYTIAHDAETTGIVELFRPQRMRYLSRGRITEQGLKPDSFLFSRTRRGQTEAALARFDWGAGSIVYGQPRESKTALLPAGAQDLISFVYQFALHPPARGRLRLPIATGSRFEVHEIDVGQEETLETPLGTLKALPLKQRVRAGEESVEIWLAAEYRYLPVRIRYFDREGNRSGDQIVSEIRVSDE